VGSLKEQVDPYRPRQALERIGDADRTVQSVIPLNQIGEKVHLGRGRKMAPSTCSIPPLFAAMLTDSGAEPPMPRRRNGDRGACLTRCDPRCGFPAFATAWWRAWHTLPMVR
jgi:hypothetical protein